MICDICHKNNSTVHLTEIIEGKVTELHLCEECARKKSEEFEKQLSFSDMLASLVGFGFDEKTDEESSLKCPSCGMNYEQFKQAGKFGCDKCYRAFQDKLLAILKRIHGATKHMGSIPTKTDIEIGKGADFKKQIMDLKQQLQQAIDMEQFEEAAKIRDEIKKLTKKLESKDK